MHATKVLTRASIELCESPKGASSSSPWARERFNVCGNLIRWRVCLPVLNNPISVSIAPAACRSFYSFPLFAPFSLSFAVDVGIWREITTEMCWREETSSITHFRAFLFIPLSRLSAACYKSWFVRLWQRAWDFKGARGSRFNKILHLLIAILML